MFGRLVEKMMRGGKATTDDGYLGRYLDAICPQFAERYEETLQKVNADSSLGNHRTVDALDVLALMVMKEIGIQNPDISASRAYLSILIENEHLPALSQLVPNELGILRDLLFSYFNGSEDTNEKGSQVLSLIERKFTSGKFSQSKILLQIFETNNETRQNNERNLYYEEMIMRLEGIPSKARGISSSLVDAALAENAGDEEVLKVFSALEQNADVRFYLYLRDQNELERWRDALAPLPSDTQDYLLDYIPIVRWRKLGALEGTLMTQFGQHMTFEMLRRYVQQKLRMCYFILLASGCTGVEWYIFAFTKWSREYFDVDVREVFPMLHRSGIVDGMCLQEVLDVTIDRFYGKKMNEIAISPEALEKAYHAAIEFIFRCDVSQIPAGHYNFGDFLLDNILHFEYQDPMFAYRLPLMM
ncbi:MAG: hypothetical protein IJM59_02800 [Proteobacteria bacterium]|jgi:hypothetical protein|nr:hypothetical protein [Pseudomonadota bacterium]